MASQGDPVAREPAFVLDAIGQPIEPKGNRLLKPLKLLQSGIHCVERSADGEDRDEDADHDGDLLLPRRLRQ